MTDSRNVRNSDATPSPADGLAPADPLRQAPPLRITQLDCQIAWAHDGNGEVTLLDLIRRAKTAKDDGDIRRCRLYLSAVLVRFERKQEDARRQIAGESV